MKNKIAEIREYFVSKMINADYEEVESDRYTMLIRIDGEYDFILWTSNGKDSLSIYHGLDQKFSIAYSFMDIKFTTKEKGLIWRKRMSDKKEKEQKQKELAEKKQYELLKKKYEKI